MGNIPISLVWIGAAAAFGFCVTAVCAGRLRMPRTAFLGVYIPLATGLFLAFVLTRDIHIRELFFHRWGWGLLGSVVAGAFVIANVFSQPSTPRREGGALVADVLWPGLAYGIVDALLLSVLPILAVGTALAGGEWTAGWVGGLGGGAVALVASLFVTGAYHLGFPEFRGKPMLGALFGNGILSLAYLLTGSPLAAVLPHAAMHVAAMVHGRETTAQLPPHYGRSA